MTKIIKLHSVSLLMVAFRESDLLPCMIRCLFMHTCLQIDSVIEILCL